MYTDQELIAGCNKNDRSMQKALYDTYAPRLMIVCMRYSNSQEEAEDVLQEAMIKVFRSMDKFREESQLFYWLKRITINTALNKLRNKVQLSSLDDQEEKFDENAWDAVSGFQFEELLAMVQKLPEGCQIVFNLHAIEGFKHEEIAGQLGISVGTSKSQLSRAKILLKEKLRTEELRCHG
ncbi:MAG: RNA polymerase sigma factor [Cytophagales bacterium]|nr:RNA polymerase sigma factor [Cytophagales bacterium]